MNKIKILSDVVANKIAAGEVVERPASVVKELVENAVDAGADAVAVSVEGGGRRLIRVSDNGEGMTHDDALLSIDRHATSKISSSEDIERIITLGFRGEALPSIVSVSKAVIETRTKSETFGTRLVINGGELRNVTETGRDPGTDVEIRNLFFNMPAWRKFLRTESTELKHIKSVTYEAAVANPGISFTLISENRKLFAFKKCKDYGEMLPQIFGKTLSDHMLPLEAIVDNVEVRGWFGKPETSSTAYNQYVIVNGRPVKSRSIVKAVYDGYGPALQRGLFPAFAIYLNIDPVRVDVNMHPAKREIRIHREFMLLQGLTAQIAELMGSRGAMPDLSGYREPASGTRNGSGTPVTVYNPPDDRWYRDEVRSRGNAHFAGEALSAQTTMTFAGLSQPSVRPEIQAQEPVSVRFEGPTFIQLDNTYIITTIREGAIIVDQHVAHERILYEEILENLRGKSASAQQLLFPITFDFSVAEWDVLEPMLPHLNTIGFGIRRFGERSVMLDAVPAGMSGCEDGKILFEFIEEMRQHGKITSGYLEKLAAALACRAAVKSGKPLNQSEMQYFIDRLFATGSPFVCPHGRPTMVKLTLDELGRRFGR